MIRAIVMTLIDRVRNRGFSVSDPEPLNTWQEYVCCFSVGHDGNVMIVDVFQDNVEIYWGLARLMETETLVYYNDPQFLEVFDAALDKLSARHR